MNEINQEIMDLSKELPHSYEYLMSAFEKLGNIKLVKPAAQLAIVSRRILFSNDPMEMDVCGDILKVLEK